MKIRYVMKTKRVKLYLIIPILRLFKVSSEREREHPIFEKGKLDLSEPVHARILQGAASFILPLRFI